MQMELTMNRQARQTIPTRKRASRATRAIANIVAVSSFALFLAACNGGAGGVASYQGDSSYGCRASATKTTCPR